MKKSITFIFFLFLSITLFGQETSSRHAISFEFIPVGHQFDIGNGLSIGYQFELGSVTHAFTLGYFFTNYRSGYESQGWSTEIDRNTEVDHPLLSQIHYDELQNLGFVQFDIKSDYRLNRSLTYEICYTLLESKINIIGGLGVTAGLTNREYTVDALEGEIINTLDQIFTGSLWIPLNVRARYLYFGPVAKMIIEYPINDRLSAGLSGGLHYVLNKNFEPDDAMYYLGIRAKVNF